MAKTTSAIQRELKQRRPFRSAHQEATLALLRTADVVRRRIAGVIEPWGITVQQYNVLRIILGAGKDGIPTLDIADRMIERAPGITRLLDRLEAKKLVRRQRCPTDRRQVMCWITEPGLRLLGKMEESVDQADHMAIGDVAAGELDRFIGLLDAVRREVK